MTGDYVDPLYRPRRELMATGEQLELGGVLAVVTTVDTAPDALEAQWMDDREVTLAFRDDIDPRDFADLLLEFAAHAAGLADRPTTAAFSLASRDVLHSRVARAAGFLPASLLAVADLRRADPPASPAGSITVRDAVPADAEAVAALWHEQASYEGLIGTLRTSDAIRVAITARTHEAIAGTTAVLVAEVDGAVAGAVVAETPADSIWAESQLMVSPSSYLAMASTGASARSRGVGTALVNELHRRHRAAGLAASTLHYSAFNPLSVPFWSQRGYRPVVTIFAKKIPVPT